MKQHRFLNLHWRLTRPLSDSLCCCPWEAVHVNDDYLDHEVSGESSDTLWGNGEKRMHFVSALE